MTILDDLGHPVPRPAAPRRRVVSLVPSLTEALASLHPERLVGATDWCSHPVDLAVSRVRGTKNPDLAAVRALAPDLVVTNKEENRELDVRRLREAGVPVWVTDIETVPQAFESMQRLFSQALGWDLPDWFDQARALWSDPVPAPVCEVAVPIWRDPWMVVGARTFTADLLARVGLPTPFASPSTGERYPTTTPTDIARSGAQLVLLPDEPYLFTETDGPEAFTLPCELLEGRLVTWYGPSLVEAHHVLTRLARKTQRVEQPARSQGRRVRFRTGSTHDGSPGHGRSDQVPSNRGDLP